MPEEERDENNLQYADEGWREVNNPPVLVCLVCFKVLGVRKYGAHGEGCDNTEANRSTLKHCELLGKSLGQGFDDHLSVDYVVDARGEAE